MCGSEGEWVFMYIYLYDMHDISKLFLILRKKTKPFRIIFINNNPKNSMNHAKLCVPSLLPQYILWIAYSMNICIAWRILIWWLTVRHKLYARYFIRVSIFLSSRSVSSWIYSVHNRVYACVRFVFLESEQRLPVIYHRIRKKGKDAEWYLCVSF